MQKTFSINGGKMSADAMPQPQSEIEPDKEEIKDKEWLVGYIEKYLETNDFAETPVDEYQEKKKDGEMKYTERESDRVINFIIEQSGVGREEIEEILKKNGINLFFLVAKIQEKTGERSNKNQESQKQKNIQPSQKQKSSWTQDPKITKGAEAAERRHRGVLGDNY